MPYFGGKFQNIDSRRLWLTAGGHLCTQTSVMASSVLIRLITCSVDKTPRYFQVLRMSSKTKPAFLVEKEKLLSMSDEERKSRFKSGVTSLKDIDTWDVFYRKNKERLDKFDKNVYVSKFNLKKYETKPEINKKISIWKGDITKLDIDAIVNAANCSLLGGGGVDGAIHRAAGKFLKEECKGLNGCETGSAKITGGYNLPAKYVIHTVGPQGEIPKLLESCYSTCLKIVLQNELKSVAFPCVSTGIYGYPQDSAASVALKCTREFLEENSSKVERIVFCLFLEKDVEIYETMLQSFFPSE